MLERDLLLLTPLPLHLSIALLSILPPLACHVSLGARLPSCLCRCWSVRERVMFIERHAEGNLVVVDV